MRSSAAWAWTGTTPTHIPFCYSERAANILTNPQLDPFGNIPEDEFCAARITAAGPAA